MSAPQVSIASAQCDYCGSTLSRHNLAQHTKVQHPGKAVKEKLKRQHTTDSFVFPKVLRVAAQEADEDDNPLDENPEEVAPARNVEETLAENTEGVTLQKINEKADKIIESVDTNIMSKKSKLPFYLHTSHLFGL